MKRKRNRKLSAKRGWETRRRNQQRKKRQLSAKRGWETRRKLEKLRRKPSNRKPKKKLKFIKKQIRDNSPYELCELSDRKRLYKNLLDDWKALSKQLTSLQFKNVEIFVVFEPGSSGQMVRTFRGDSTNQLYNFFFKTNKREKYSGERWDKEHFCSYEKEIVIARETGKRRIGKIYKKYDVVPPDDIDEDE